MNKYKVIIEYAETTYYNYEKEIEADTKANAKARAEDDLLNNLALYSCGSETTVYDSSARLTTGVSTFYTVWYCGESNSYENCDKPSYVNDYEELEPAIMCARSKAQKVYDNGAYDRLICVCKTEIQIKDNKEESRTNTPVANIRSLSQPIECGYTEEIIGG